MILYGNDLIQKIRTDFDNASNRIYIAVPFIGDWKFVKRIMGTRWINNTNLDMKIITDIRNEDYINNETIKQFLHKTEVRTLAGLHAKIYILNDSVFITSANLTGTAFAKRYEICDYFEISRNHEILDVFEDWWQRSKPVNNNWQPRTKNKKNQIDDAGNVDGLKGLWDLPEDEVIVGHFKDYQDNIIYYNHFLNIYESDGDRILPKLPSYHELDAFLNYLFHEADNTPSNIYQDKKFRKISQAKRQAEVIKYKKEFKKWITKKGKTEEYYRKSRIEIVRKNLSRKNIKQLDRGKLEEVVNSLHTMNSHALNRHKFLNPENNSLKVIKESFNALLHDDDMLIEERMEICDQTLRHFGKNSIRELVAWYYPDKYPIMNSNSNSGLKFFGYDINTH